MDKLEREKIILNYLESYNNFDINKMVTHFDENIVFENISNGEINLSLTGLESFKKQAEQAKTYFSSRTQTIKSCKHQDNETEIDIYYYAILAVDFPNGPQKGETLKLQGKSIFTFLGDRIVKLTDIS